jgi:hypothetical protein
VYGVQSVVVAGWQVPAPSQVRAATALSPMQPGGAHAVPDGRGEHVPTLPGKSQDEQEPPHALLQQTPWGAQKLDMQSDGCAHGCPSARWPQLPPVQTAGGAQPFAGGVQLVAHSVALAQAYGAHDVAGGVTQAPLPSQAGA